MALRRSVPRLFLERQQKYLRHPLIWTGQDFDGKRQHVAPPFFTWIAFRPALFLAFLYVIWDRFFGPYAHRYHPHARFQYGIMGETVHFPNAGVHHGWNLNLPRIIDGSGFSAFEGYGVGRSSPETFSPFLKQYGQKASDGHHH